MQNNGSGGLCNGYIVSSRKGVTHGERYESRVVAAQVLGRPLEACERVFHLNRIKTDNRPENLVVKRYTRNEKGAWTRETIVLASRLPAAG